ncbi:hypothetical protein GHT06_016345 [Daphnia sinensis]|uniref:Uncharacterized protein n=1 Tax=Daphnia sinensis TaxID=1820382 RepID=A0AAD5L5H0_9CRUS|nr:hypothetical protein GHT06_016345 [Daphnia sinensis]
MCGPGTMVRLVICRSVFDSRHLQLPFPPSSMPSLSSTLSHSLPPSLPYAPTVSLLYMLRHLHHTSQRTSLNISSDFVGYSTSSWLCFNQDMLKITRRHYYTTKNNTTRMTPTQQLDTYTDVLDL